MRDKKDRGNKWLIEHHADSILRLAQVQGFTGWRPRPGEVVVPKALPDGLVEVTFPKQEKADLFLIEVSTYSDVRVEEQLERDVLLVQLDRKVLPEVICLVLHPQGEYRIKAKRRSVSRLGHTTLEVGWTVVEMWQVRAQTLLDMNDVGVIPYVPVSQFDEPPEVVFQWCRERIEEQASPDERSSLLAVTWVLAGTRFKDQALLDIIMRRPAVIESPVLQELVDELSADRVRKAKLQERHETVQANIIRVLKARLGLDAVPEDLAEQIRAVGGEQRLEHLLDRAAVCRDVAEFRGDLSSSTGGTP